MENVNIKTSKSVNHAVRKPLIMDLSTDNIWICSQKKLNIMENITKMKYIVHTGTNELIEHLREREQELCQEIDEKCFNQYNDIEAYMLAELSRKLTVREDMTNTLDAGCIGVPKTQNLELPPYIKKHAIFLSNFKDVKAMLKNYSFGEVKIVDSAIEGDVKKTFESKQSEEKHKAGKLEHYQSVEIDKESTVSEASFELLETDMTEPENLEEELLTDEDDIDFVVETESTQIPSWQPAKASKGGRSPKTLVEACLSRYKSPTREKNPTQCFIQMMQSIKKDEAKKCAKSQDAEILSPEPSSENDTEPSTEPSLKLQKQLEGLKMSKESRYLISDDKQSEQSLKKDAEKIPGVKTSIWKDIPPVKKRYSFMVSSNSSLLPESQDYSKEFNALHYQLKDEMPSISECSNVSATKFSESSLEVSPLYPVQSKEYKPDMMTLLQDSLDIYLHKDDNKKWLHSKDEEYKWLHSCALKRKIAKLSREHAYQIQLRELNNIESNS